MQQAVDAASGLAPPANMHAKLALETCTQNLHLHANAQPPRHFALPACVAAPWKSQNCIGPNTRRLHIAPFSETRWSRQDGTPLQNPLTLTERFSASSWTRSFVFTQSLAKSARDRVGSWDVILLVEPTG
jgi:hypothetical protein